ncbi:MFS transporter [Bacillus sp. JCM 19034]|uniref:MFS transporter n=1 Tax=Bacillus sp. JCM 19034 TaxID=1481928 RepID=UPI000780757B|nr:MFS transporter [Bacillus sp. JCM 19034]
MIIGGGLQVLFYLLILFLAEKSIEWIHLLGLCFGIGSGFYWLSVNVLSVDLTNQENRTWFNGVNGLFGSLSQMIGPFMAGILVSKLPNLTGYKVIFMLSLLLFIVTIVLSMLLPVIRLKNRFQWKKMYQVNRNKEWRQLTYAFMGLAFRDGVLSFVILLWVFVVTSSEAIVGNFAFLTTLLSVITYYVVGKFTKNTSQKWLLVIGNIGLSAAIFSLIIDVNWFVLLIYGIISAICIPLFEVPFNTMSLNNIANLDENGLTRVELVTSREIALSAGRITSVGLLVIVYSSLQSELLLQYFLGVVIVVGMTPLLFIRRMKEVRN